MTVRELIDSLEELGLDDAEVMIATQPSYPLATTLKGVVVDVEEEEEEEGEEMKPAMVWLVEGGAHRTHSPYAPGYLWDAC